MLENTVHHTMFIFPQVLLLCVWCFARKTLTALEPVEIKRCNEEAKSGSIRQLIYIYYNDINSQCNCTIKSHFTGVLQITSTNKESRECFSEITISDMENDDNVLTLPCTENRISQTSNVSTDSVLRMIPRYFNSTCERIYQEIRIFEEGKNGGNVSVACGNFPSMSSSTSIAAEKTLKDRGVSLSGESSSSKSSSTTISSNDKDSEVLSDVTNIQTYMKTESIVVTSFSDDTTSKVVSYDTNINVKRSSTDTSSKAGTDDTNIQKGKTDTDPISIYIISGICGAVAVTMIGIVCLVTWRLSFSFRRPQSVPKSSKQFGLQKNDTYDAELPDNPLYHSYQPLENSDNNTSKEQQEDLQCSTEKDTDIEENPIYAKPHKIKE